jgi:hypothetical protein
MIRKNNEGCLPQALSFQSSARLSILTTITVTQILQKGRLNLWALQLQEWLQSLSVYLESTAILWILNLNGPMRKY